MQDRANGSVSKAIKDILIDSLGVDADTIVPEARLVNDLGAESIDFLDIAFRVEEELGVKMPLKEWAKASESEYELTPERLAQRLSRVFNVELSLPETARVLQEGLDPLFPVIEGRFGYSLTPSEVERLRAAVDSGLGVKDFAARQIELFTVQSLVNFVAAAVVVDVEGADGAVPAAESA